ncbi:PREDICTED: sterol 26-hydroxylase, mitochondrial-like [Nanorana parkeri]|uniref:sterol 26-hydroxylase, mitochondrial-like n=1 Tax=Nanorana parkeri TaxID=125878 RepID=UPI000854CF87|nr:PREDICTED: sterol 26-hydroxylase, mitochondrial-like [Nanorana parkeri]
MISSFNRPWLLTLSQCRGQASGVGGLWHSAGSEVGGIQRCRAGGVWQSAARGLQHRALSRIRGVQHGVVNGEVGVQHRAVSRVGVQHREVSEIWGVQHRAVNGVGGVQHRAVSGAAAAAIAEEGKKVKTFDDLPGPSLLTNIYWLFLRGYLLYTHELQDIFKKKYGPMWKSSIGMFNTVYITDADLLETLLRQEGKYPMRVDMQLWKVHRHLRNLAYGPLTEEGHRWHTLRTVLNKRMLKPAEAVLYTGAINEVVTDFLSSLDVLRKETPSGVMVNDIANVFYRFAFEGISYILLETRIGCLEKKIPPESQKFIDSIGAMLKYSVYVSIFPAWTRNLLPYYRLYLENWDNIFEFGNKMIDKKMEKIQARLDSGEEVQGEYLTYLLSSGTLTDKEVNSSVAELLLAGVDTTSNTLSWALYHLARDPETQESLYQEVNDIVPGDAIPTAEDIAKMPLLKSVIKEALRLYPVLPANSRTNVEKEITLGGYSFPKNTLFVLNHYQISRDEENFPEPNKFLPQRWLRDNKVKNNPFSSIPFGYGVRACVGRRIAELEMYLTLSRIIKKYEIRPDPGSVEVSAMFRAVLSPSRPINLQFLNRTSSKSL